MKSMGVAYNKKVKKNHKIAESDVTRGSVARMDIQNVLLHIETYEEAVDKGDLNLDTIQTLSSVLYPKAIEYFSAFDNNMYNDFLNRMQSLLQREDIQMVLNSVGNEPKGEENKEIAKDSLASGVVTPGKSNGANAPVTSVDPPKPKIDFNVSEEDLAKHKQQMEEERKIESKEEGKDEDKKEEDANASAPVFAIGGGSDSEDD